MPTTSKKSAETEAVSTRAGSSPPDTACVPTA
jgi:hypothetical protein